MNIIIHDYSGHPFQLQLSRELARRGHRIRHQYCTSYSTGKGAVQHRRGDPEGFSIESLTMAKEFARYSPVKRAVQELGYGFKLGRSLHASRPQLAVMCNVPLLAHAIVSAATRLAGIPTVFWQQDVYSAAIGGAARRRLGRVAGGLVALIADYTEAAVARNSEHVIAISEAFLEVLDRWGLSSKAVTVVPNWAALPEMPVRPRDNQWARSHGLAGRHTVIYAGTLGLKHDPRVFLRLAEALQQADPEARVVVISEGQGRDLLEKEQVQLNLNNLMLLDYQPYECLPDVLGTADVLVAVLEPDASRYSVPSKVFNYLCAARPVLGVMPADNAVAITLTSSGAGVLADPRDTREAVLRMLDLLDAPQLRAEMGAAGRRYAEATFDITTIATTFEEVLFTAVRSQTRMPSGKVPVGGS